MTSSTSVAAAGGTRSRTDGTAVSPAFLGFEPYVTAEEAAEFLKITPRRVKEMARAGSIPAHPVDPNAERKEWRFLLSELSAYMRANSGTQHRM
jgi:excisionase family DNA binding protein